MKIVFFGSSDYCLPVLETLHKHFDLKLVVSRPDKPVGRKQIITASTVKTWAEKNKISVATQTTFKKDTPDRINAIKIIKDINPDLAIVSDYGLILPEGIFKLPKLETLNIHFSKLPDLRGPSPVQFTLLRGDTTAWVTVFKLENPPELEIKMDSGPILFQHPYPILPTDTTKSLYTRLFHQAAKILPNVIKDYRLPTTDYRLFPQDHSKATFTRFLSRDDGFIEWSLLQQALQDQVLQRASVQHLPKIQQEALRLRSGQALATLNTKYLYDFFRAMTPWPGMWTLLRQSADQGKLQRMITRQCHLEGEKLILDEIQFEGKKPQPFSDTLLS